MISHDLLKWKDDLSPRYNVAKRRKNIKARYINSIKPIEITLPKLMLEKSFMETVQYLRNEGWLDWQILMTVANHAVSYRVNSRFTPDEISLYREKFNEFMHTPESEYYIPIPLEEFSRSNLEFQMNVMMSTILPANSLENHSETPKLEAMREFLNKRFKLNLDDVEGMSPFKF